MTPNAQEGLATAAVMFAMLAGLALIVWAMNSGGRK